VSATAKLSANKASHKHFGFFRGGHPHGGRGGCGGRKSPSPPPPPKPQPQPQPVQGQCGRRGGLLAGLFGWRRNQNCQQGGAVVQQRTFASFQWKWRFSLGWGLPVPTDLQINDFQARFIHILRFLLTSGRRVYLQVLFDGTIVFRENYDRSADGAHIIITGTSANPEGEQLDRINALEDLLDEQFKDYRIDINLNAFQTFEEPDQWLITLRQWLKQGKRCIVRILFGGRIEVVQDTRPIVGGRAGFIFEFDDKDSLQKGIYNTITQTVQQDNSLKGFWINVPAQEEVPQFNVKAHWYITLVQLLKQNRQVVIDVDEDGFIDVREAPTQTGKAGYTILTDIKQITDVNSPQYQALFKLQNFVKIQKSTLEQYITVTSTTTTTTTKQVGGIEAFLDALAKLLAEKRQFTITIRPDGTYDVQENQKKSGTEPFFVVVYSSATPNAVQKDAYTRLYTALKTRPSIIKYDKSQQKDDPFNAVIKTTTTVTTTKTVKKTL
jgi:hypothetical protein